MVLRPGSEIHAEEIFRKWELDFAVIGQTTDTGRLEVFHRGSVEVDIPIPALADNAPVYERPYQLKKPPAITKAEDVPAAGSNIEALVQLMGSPQLCSRRWIWEQYDHMVMADTVQRPGGDAAVLRIHGTNKGIAASCDVTPRYCHADPFEGGKQAVAESWRNLIAVGATPLAITDCLNFGNPERPEIMGEFVGCIQGMAQACHVLAFPVVSGNVSLYNETNGIAIPPTPAIGSVGILPDLTQSATIALRPEQAIVLIGAETGHLGQSIYQMMMTGHFTGAPPPVDLDAEKRTGDLVRMLVCDGVCNTAHDVSDGGLLVALAEMSLAGKTGVILTERGQHLPLHANYFGEEQGRYILAVSKDRLELVLEKAEAVSVPARILGKATGDHIVLPGEDPLPLKRLLSEYEAWFPRYFGEC